MIVENVSFYQRALKEMKLSLKHLIKGLEGEYIEIDARVETLLREMDESHAAFVFTDAIKDFVKSRNHHKALHAEEQEESLHNLKHKLNNIDKANVSPSQRDKIDKIEEAIKGKDKSITDILSLMGDSITCFSFDAAETRKVSKTLTGEQHNHIKHNDNELVAADIQLASRRLSKDLSGICAMLVTAVPDSDELKDLYRDCKEIQDKPNAFFLAIDLVSSLSSHVRNVINQDSLNTKEMLIKIQQKVVNVYKQSELLAELSDNAGANTDAIHNAIGGELDALLLRTEKCKTVDEAQMLLLKSIDSVNEKMACYVKRQRKLVLSQKNKIGTLSRELTSAIGDVKKLKCQVIETQDKLAIDALTGIGNRRGYNQAIEKYCDKLKRGDIKKLSLIVMDIDKFKSVNDNYGHDVGDQVIKRVASLSNDIIKDQGYVARYGGEEFVIILPDTSAKEAAFVSQNIRNSISSRRFRLRNKNTSLQVTLSAGVSDFSEASTFSKQVFDNADRALYRAKEGGRDRTVVEIKNEYFTIKENAQ